jgi:hypothetical protein
LGADDISLSSPQGEISIEFRNSFFMPHRRHEPKLLGPVLAEITQWCLQDSEEGLPSSIKSGIAKLHLHDSSRMMFAK